MMPRTMLVVLSLWAGLMGPAAAAEDLPPRTLDELKAAIGRIVTETKTPAMGIALVDRNGPYWVTSFGKADLASGRAADENTLYRIGSISKMFAALSVLKLVEEGKLSLDDTLRERAPDVAFENEWESTHPVRIAHLLEHTTGWDDIHIPEYAYSAPDAFTTKQGLDYHPDSRKSRWPPGTRHAYCNSGSAVAAYVVERITGQRFEDYVARTFFAPLGMDSSSYFKTRFYDERGATLYMGSKPQDYWHIIHRAAGSINSSPRDMAKFLHFLLMRGSTAAGPIVSARSIDDMETPRTLPGNAAGIRAGYALANYTTGHKSMGVAFRGHDGGMMGAIAHLAYSNEIGQGYILMINTGDPSAIGRSADLIKDYLLRDAKAPEAGPSVLPERYKRIDGYYEPINPRNQSMALIMSFVGILKVTHDDKVLHRSPLLGGWTSDDPVGESGVLIDRWSGLPTIALVDDLLAGPTLQIASDLLQRVPGWKVFARLAMVGLLVLMTLVSFVALVVWAARRARRKTDDSRVWLRVLPLAASAALIVYLVGSGVAQLFLESLGTVTPVSVALFVLSILYPAVTLLAAAGLLTRKAREKLDLPYWFAAAFVLVHVCAVAYLAEFDGIAIRSWS